MAKDLSTRVFQYGDVDSRGASGADRIGIVDAEERAALSQAKFNGEGSIRQAYTKYEDSLLKYERIRQRRAKRNEAQKPRIKFADAWRALNIQERYPHAHLPPVVQALVFLLLAGLDFYVFAQAYAVVDDVEDYSAQWFVGGLLGLVVFVAGVILAHQIKTYMVGRAQRRLVDELREEDPDFRPRYHVAGKERTLSFSRASMLALVLSILIFGTLVGLAIVVRFEGDASDDWAVVLMTGVIPLVIVAVEIYLHDPLYRLEAPPGWREKQAERRCRTRRIQVENIIARYDGYIAQTRAGFAHQRSIAKVTAEDLGIPVETDGRSDSDAAGQNEWAIDVDGLLSTKFQRTEREKQVLKDGDADGAE